MELLILAFAIGIWALVGGLLWCLIGGFAILWLWFKKSDSDTEGDRMKAVALLIGRLTAIATVVWLSIRYGWLGLLLPHIIRAIKGL